MMIITHIYMYFQILSYAKTFIDLTKHDNLSMQKVSRIQVCNRFASRCRELIYILTFFIINRKQIRPEDCRKLKYADRPQKVSECKNVPLGVISGGAERHAS